MSDSMRPMAFGKLMGWILGEKERHSQVFGLNEPFMKKTRGGAGSAFPLFREKLEIPCGPAAGPHTQLSQNIVASYYGGGRFFELKTVQAIDGEDLPVAKPCIDAADEGYNCEWSTELTVPEAFGEYVRAWFALKLLAKEFGLGDPEGFIFNMSVGYDLAGIQSPKIDGFIEGLKDASGTAVWDECIRWAKGSLSRFAHIDRAYVENISPHVCASVTLSTLHGCPPGEIEKIARYLLTEKKLHTFVKCNPTMLGYESARAILDGLGFDYVAFDDRHFRGDLQFADAVPMFKRLEKTAAGEGLTFGLKLSNTCPVDNTGGALPGGEVYMSGRALYPLTVTLAEKLAAAFEGKIRISYSGGADFFTVRKLVEAGVWPVTMATALLKPGGYRRLTQCAKELESCVYGDFEGVDVSALGRIAGGLTKEKRNYKAAKPLPSRKLAGKAPLFDCFTAPCEGGCPIGQDIPAYLSLTAEGRYLEALELITRKNPLPYITGTICSHRCMDKCTRHFYEEPVDIRGAKLAAAEGAYGALLGTIREAGAAAATDDAKEQGRVRSRKDDPGGEGAGSDTKAAGGARKESQAQEAGQTQEIDQAKAVGRAQAMDQAQVLNQTQWADQMRVAVVGGGPAGLAAAYFLARGGVRVTVFEKASKPGGVVRQAIPDFRISDVAIDKDVALVEAMGAQIRTGVSITSVRELREQGFRHIILAIGAWAPGSLALEKGESLNALAFLKGCKEGRAGIALGRNVAVIGGGNAAMDAARVAKRAPGVEKVSLVYRRTRRYMPADEEELALALEDGVEFRELLTPASLSGGKLICRRTALGEPDSSGRRQPVETGEIEEVEADTVIGAVGEKVDRAFYQANGLAVDGGGKPLVREGSWESVNVPEVYIIGDGLSGPATVAEAIACAQGAAASILCKLHIEGSGLTHREGMGRTSLNHAEDAEGVIPAHTEDAEGCRTAYAQLLHSPSQQSAPAPQGAFGPSRGEILARQGILCMAGDPGKEGGRCLSCGAVCENCAQVCPNRANIAIQVPGYAQSQILHIDSMCNECGNCAVFCPYDSKPYRDKLTLFVSEEDFADSENQGFLLLGATQPQEASLLYGATSPHGAAPPRFKTRLEGRIFVAAIEELPPDWQAVIKTIQVGYPWLLCHLYTSQDST